jgi:hypothetical protein
VQLVNIINCTIDQKLHRKFKCTYEKGELKRVGLMSKASVHITSNTLYR